MSASTAAGDLPAALAERPTDPSYGVPVPFVCERDDGPYSLASLNRKRVIQCALSRICGMCALSLDNPLVLVGTADDADRNDFRIPPLHMECARAVLALYPRLAMPLFGYDRHSPTWAMVCTGGFDFQRPTVRGEAVTFRPNAITSDRRVEI